MKNLVLLLFLFIGQICFAQIVNIPDANFKAALIEQGVDTNNDNEIQVAEAEAVTSLQFFHDNISSFEGIASFTNLIGFNSDNNPATSIDVSNNTSLEVLSFVANPISSIDLTNNTNLKHFTCKSGQLTSIDVSNNILLEHLDIQSNQLTSLDVSSNTELNYLVFARNNITSIDVSNNLQLTYLHGHENALSSLDVSNNNALTTLVFSNNNIASIDLSSNPDLTTLNCKVNNLTAIDLSNNPLLQLIDINYNDLTTIDISNNPELTTLTAYSNKLEYVNMKNGNATNSILDLRENNDLAYVCIDLEERDYIQERVDSFGYTNCVINSFCTFVPGGEVYYIQGNVKVDINQNGCDENDLGFPFMQLRVEDTEGNFGIYSTGIEGDYDIAVPEGSYNITYQFPYSTYFDVTPPSFSVDFPTESSPFAQDICLTPNGTYNDLQVTILPTNEARPGFDANYKLIYANVGTMPLSGDVLLNFEDDVLDFVSASTNPDSQNTGSLSWSFTGLAPLEYRTIDLVMNLNSPTETPPLNGGEILCYDVSISPSTNDHVPSDNDFSLKQTVVNSYDPNDKTCLEGNIITPDLVGEYVHYLIRFENTGTVSAINVVVRDVIDTNQFDMSSFVPLDSSHDFVTRIQNQNEIEFIFEGIELPFDDANNDGYILFKIKTLPTLELGDTFENSAEIYFDFNFPIISNV